MHGAENLSHYIGLLLVSRHLIRSHDGNTTLIYRPQDAVGFPDEVDGILRVSLGVYVSCGKRY